MDKEELKNLIQDKQEDFLKKLKYAGLNDLEYWEKRPENLSKEMLERYLNSLQVGRSVPLKMSPRESDEGKYSETGFKWVFSIEDEFEVMGHSIKIYLKGFFFEIDDPRGVEIQSFKKSTPKLTVVK
ncbi:MAG: hypothetical protein HOE90_24615 [Bacteriovoracaceae bacterium]|jgi:hypothetical protein|nr:hypothetical protein [Bacteriovoracaceae bacterium]